MKLLKMTAVAVTFLFMQTTFASIKPASTVQQSAKPTAMVKDSAVQTPCPLQAKVSRFAKTAATKGTGTSDKKSSSGSAIGVDGDPT